MVNSASMDIILKKVRQKKYGINTTDKRESFISYFDIYIKAKKIVNSLNYINTLKNSIIVIAIDDFWKRLLITLSCYIGHINHITLGSSKIENEVILKELIDNIEKFNFIISNNYEALFQSDYVRKNIQYDLILLTINDKHTLYQINDRKSCIKFNLNKYGCVLGREYEEDSIISGIKSIAPIVDQINNIVIILPLFGSMSEIEIFLAAAYYRKNIYVVKDIEEYEIIKKEKMSNSNILLFLSSTLKKDLGKIIYYQNAKTGFFERVIDLSGKMDELFVASLSENNYISISMNIELYTLKGADFILYGYSLYKLDIGEISRISKFDNNQKIIYCLTKRNIDSRNYSEFLLEDIDVKINHNNQHDNVGDIYVRGKKVFHNYFYLSLKTKKEFSNDGWFKTNYIGTFNRKNSKVCFRDNNKNLIWTDKVLYSINEFNTCFNYVSGLNLDGYCCYFRNYIEAENEIIYFIKTKQNSQIYKQIYYYAADFFQKTIDYDKYKIILVDDFHYNSNGELIEYLLIDNYIKEKSEEIKIAEEEIEVQYVDDSIQNEERILQEVIEILETSTKIKNIDIDRNWNELQIDSLSSLYVINELEDKYGIQIFENVLENNYSVRSIINYLISNGKA